MSITGYGLGYHENGWQFEFVKALEQKDLRCCLKIKLIIIIFPNISTVGILYIVGKEPKDHREHLTQSTTKLFSLHRQWNNPDNDIWS